MAKKKEIKPVDTTELINESEIKPVDTGLIEIELIVDVSGMKKGDIKKLPKSLANQMVNSNKAKFKI
jgi:hypothetical protein